jgi:hypothetical protein
MLTKRKRKFASRACRVARERLRGSRAFRRLDKTLQNRGEFAA